MPRIRPVLLTALLALPVLAADALAAAGGGTSSYGGSGASRSYGGSSGGTSFTTTGGTGSKGSALVAAIVIAGFLLLTLAGFIAERRRRRRRRQRVERTLRAAAVAAEDDPWFAADVVIAEAADLYRRTQAAWDARDREELARLVGEDLMVEWNRRLDDFERKGWHSRVSIDRGPQVEYVGITNREDDTQDRVVVRIEARLRDVVEDRHGNVIRRKGEQGELVWTREWWTLGRRDDRWIVVSIEQDAEGEHHLDAPLVVAPWADDALLADEAALERAAAETLPEGVAPGELVDVHLADDARAQALDLSLVDERFAPHVLEAAARRAVTAWAEAVDGDDAALEAIATPEAVRHLLYPDGASGRLRIVVRGPRLRELRIVALDGHADPATITVEADVEGRRYVEDRDTLALLSGSRDVEARFTVRWTLALSGDAATPWRLVGPAAPAAT
jgi:predicted lipid-binding transport protein (Tim44 family)